MRATTAPRHTGQSSARRLPTPTSADGFALSGRSSLPDPEFNAFRKDLADVTLAGTVIASHYAEPQPRLISKSSPLRAAPSEEAAILRELSSGESFALLDECIGWAWGYAGEEGRVGYVESAALAAR